MKIKDLAKGGIFSDGDWVESKDQDTNGQIRLIQLADIGDGYFINKSNRYMNKETAQRLRCTFLKKGDILIARMPDPIGRCCLFPFDENEKYVTVVDVCIIRIVESHDLNYLKYAINSSLIRRQIEEQVTGTTRLRITKKKIGELNIPLPPLATQKKIAAILDAADAHRQKTKQLLAKYDELAQSIFLDMFGDPGKREFEHVEYSMEQVASKITDGDHATPERTESGFKLLSCRNVKNSFLDFEVGVDYVGQAEFDRMSKRCNPERGDILVSCSGTIGRTTSIKTDEPFVLVRSAALIKPKRNLVNSLYLEKYLQTPFMQAVMIRKANTSSQSNLFTGPIKSLPVLLPSLELQNEFAERIQSIESQKEKVEVGLKESENLFNSLLQKAFKGELNV